MNTAIVINEILKLAPMELQESYDNSGLQVGNTDQPLKNIMLSLDVDDITIEKAKSKDANLIISHHPMIFSAIKKIDARNNTGKKIIEAIKNDICIFSCHTNFDSAYGGLSDILAELIAVQNLIPLINHEYTDIYKLVVFVPTGFEAKVRDALFLAGAGVIGNYAHCSFIQKGEGTFFAPENSNPFIGEKGQDNSVEESRLETIVQKQRLDKTIEALRKSHPYEEPAFDIYPLALKSLSTGLGRIGELPEKTTLAELAELVKEKLKTKRLRYIGNGGAKIKKVAIATGSGGSMIPVAFKKNADVLITGDIKYHEAKMAEEAGLCVIDAGHFATEVIFVDFMKSYLTKYLKSAKSDIKVFTDKGSDPFNVI